MYWVCAELQYQVQQVVIGVTTHRTATLKTKPRLRNFTEEKGCSVSAMKLQECEHLS